MILASHVILSTYGFWLPNEERGSWSNFVTSWDLFRYGPATKVQTTSSVARRSFDRDHKQQMQESLRYPPVSFSGIQAREIARAFGELSRKSNYTIYGCAILPEHVHLIVREHHYPVAQVANLLKGAATTHLIRKGLHPMIHYRSGTKSVATMWAGRLWKVFIDNERHLRCAIDYVARNPEKEGKRRQSWSWITRLD